MANSMESPEVKKEELPSQEAIEGKEAKLTPEAQEKIDELGKERASMMTRIVTNEVTSQGLDLVPFAGGAKMLTESICGKTLSQKEMSGKERIIHAACGLGCLVLDFTGIGEVKDVGILTGKSVVLLEKLGEKLVASGAKEAAELVAKMTVFMAKNPELVAKAEEHTEAALKWSIEKLKSYRAGDRPERKELPQAA